MPENRTVNHTVFDHISVLKMIESVFKVKPLAVRETSNDVGNLLSLIDLSRSRQAAPTLPQPQPVPPQTICSSSIVSAPAGATTLFGTDDEPRNFQKLEQAARERGWPIYEE